MPIKKPDLKGLGQLANPHYFTGPISIEGLSIDFLKSKLYSMMLIREVEFEIAKMVRENAFACPTHLAVGQEAIAVGISAHLRNTDRVFSGHRCHAHYLALGGSVYKLLAEILGRETGCSKGMGGSMHLFDDSVGFKGSVPLVGATISLAVGAALAAKLDQSQDIGVTYFGDGAAEEGVLHESLNLASTYQLPVLFVCENNLYSSHLDINLRQPSDRVSRFAEAHCMPYASIDGNDIGLVSDTAEKMIRSMREGQGPAFLEVITYRWLGHVGPNEDIDVGVRRQMEDIAAWKKRDPIKRLETAMLEKELITKESIQEMHQKILDSIQEDKQKALNAPYPEESTLLERVYINQKTPSLRKAS